MNPDHHGSYWHVGGSILTRVLRPDGPTTEVVPLRYARELFKFYSDEALMADAVGDKAGARYCAHTAIAVLKAVCDCERWQEASKPVRSAEVVPFPRPTISEGAL